MLWEQELTFSASHLFSITRYKHGENCFLSLLETKRKTEGKKRKQLLVYSVIKIVTLFASAIITSIARTCAMFLTRSSVSGAVLTSFFRIVFVTLFTFFVTENLSNFQDFLI